MRAAFLDRDGVINHNVFYADTQEWESPRTVNDLKIIAGVVESIRLLQNAGFLIFIVSNQPSYAKGKTTLENLYQIQQQLHQQLEMDGIQLQETFYCYHHPQGIVADYAITCQCRKPSPFFLLQAQKKYQLEMKHSWMIGDRETDILCGEAAGVQTLHIIPDHPVKTSAIAQTKSYVDLKTAVDHIVLKD